MTEVKKPGDDKEKMAQKSPTLYNLNKTHIAFAFAGLALFVGLVMMVLQDSDREWKRWQREFMDYSLHKTERDLEEIEKKEDKAKRQELTHQLEQGRQEVRTHAGEIQRIRKEIEALDFEIAKGKTRFQDLKQLQDSDRYFYEDHLHKGEKGEAAKYQKKLAQREPKIKEAAVKFDLLETEREEKLTEINQFEQKIKDAEKQIRLRAQDEDRLKAKLKKLEYDWIQAILNAPMLDFLRPSLQIQQIVVENLYDDYYFSKVQKVDRCITCHLGIDQKGFEKAPLPFKSHPRLDLFLSPDSPHPMEEFGCTVCHGGSGQSVSFFTAAHTPQNSEQAHDWEKEYHWKPMKHWSEKMLPLQHSEAACLKCHKGVENVPEATHLNKGIYLAETFGCFGCHKVAGYENRWKVGPDLTHAQSKLDQDWIVRWLHNPKEFRPSTKMPRVFHLSNASDPDSRAKNDAAIAGIASYLIKYSDPVSLQTAPDGGKPEMGEKLIKEIGCLGCHSMGEMAANDHGPELAGLGSKVKADWLFTWLKDPKHYSPDTRMPNLRLTNEDASHITSYLLTLRNEKFESLRPPLVKPEVVDEMALAYLTGKMHIREANAELAKMGAGEKLEYLGKQVISQQGCFGCHAIKGFEDTKPIGTELTEEGSKDIHKLDFGFIHLDHTREAWFMQKLKEPRIFDQGKVKTWYEKLRMPQFDFTEDQAQSLTTFLLSLQKAQIPLQMQRRLNLKEQDIEAGRVLVTKLNCQGCHTMDGVEGRIRSITPDPGNAPPVIDGEGRKVHSDWLYQFLAAPEAIRPWLHYRMPTFNFSDQELNTVIKYFNGLAKVPEDFSGAAPHPTQEELAAGRELFSAFQCIKCHKSNPDPKLSASFLAPDLVIAKERLRPDWVSDWLKDPQALQPGTMMPAFFPDGITPVTKILDGDAGKQIKAIRDYLWHFTPEEAAAVTASTTGKK